MAAFFLFLKNIPLRFWIYGAAAISLSILLGLYKHSQAQLDEAKTQVEQSKVELSVASELNKTQAATFKSTIDMQNQAIASMKEAGDRKAAQLQLAQQSVVKIARDRDAVIAQLKLQPVANQTCTEAFELLRADTDKLIWTK